MRIVFDTNTLISASLAKGKPRELLLKALANEFELIGSKGLLNELEDVINRPKFNLSSFEKYKFIRTVKGSIKLVEVKSNFKVVKQDPDDDMILNVAYDGGVNYIVSGDPDLLNLKEFEGTKIVTADEMLRILGEK